MFHSALLNVVDGGAALSARRLTVSTVSTVWVLGCCLSCRSVRPRLSVDMTSLAPATRSSEAQNENVTRHALSPPLYFIKMSVLVYWSSQSMKKQKNGWIDKENKMEIMDFI